MLFQKQREVNPSRDSTYLNRQVNALEEVSCRYEIQIQVFVRLLQNFCLGFDMRSKLLVVQIIRNERVKNLRGLNNN